MIELSTIRAITFDVGGTLIDPWPSVGHVYAEVAGQQAYAGVAPDKLNRQFIAAWKRRVDFDYSRLAWAGLVQQTFAGLIPCPADELLFDALYRRFEQPEVWRVHDDVASALARFKQRGFKLAVISNWDERLKPLLGRLGLEHYFDYIVVSCEVGHTKPSRLIFEHAARLLQMPASSIIHVGDSEQEDVLGAEQSGLQALRLNRQSDGASSREIQSLAQLTSWLALYLSKRRLGPSA